MSSMIPSLPRRTGLVPWLRYDGVWKMFFCERFAVRLFLAIAAAVVPCCAEKELVITNIMDEDPDKKVMDEVLQRPVQFWKGNYTDLTALSCNRSSDLLFDWQVMKRSMAAWLREMQLGSPRVMQTYWELIRPVQHSLTNMVAHHNITTSKDCMTGMLAVRLFYLTVQSQQYRTSQIVEANSFVIDWHYYTHLFEWGLLVRSGWASTIFPSISMISNAFHENTPWLSWSDCEELPGGQQLPATLDEVVQTISDSARLASLRQAVDGAELANVRICPVAYAFAAVVVAFGILEVEIALLYLNIAQQFIRQYREKNEYTFVNILNVRWPILSTLALVVGQISDFTGVDRPSTCQLLWCPNGGTPNQLTCECEVLFPEDHPNVTACIFMVDTRRKSSLRNITSVLNARYWTLAYGINRLYAEEHGYEAEYVRPDNETHFPERKVGWGKVKVIIEKLREYGPERCAYGVSIDTDAYMRTSESLAAAIHHYGLDDSKLILFSQEYHTELRPNNTFINGGFFIVRNSEEGVGLLEEWYNVPEDYSEMAHLKKQNPQGLNLCWDEKIQPRHADSVVLAPSHLFTAPLGSFVRHNWFKDMRFEQEMMDILLERLRRKYGCIMCQNVYDWDDSLNADPGWR